MVASCADSIVEDVGRVSVVSTAVDEPRSRPRPRRCSGPCRAVLVGRPAQPQPLVASRDLPRPVDGRGHGLTSARRRTEPSVSARRRTVVSTPGERHAEHAHRDGRDVPPRAQRRRLVPEPREPRVRRGLAGLDGQGPDDRVGERLLAVVPDRSQVPDEEDRVDKVRDTRRPDGGTPPAPVETRTIATPATRFPGVAPVQPCSATIASKIPTSNGLVEPRAGPGSPSGGPGVRGSAEPPAEPSRIQVAPPRIARPGGRRPRDGTTTRAAARRRASRGPGAAPPCRSRADRDRSGRVVSGE